MKKRSKIIIIAAVILFAAVIVGGIFMLFNKASNKTEKYNEITDFEIINLHFSGMRVTEEYEIINKGEKAEISYYQMNYSSGKEERQLKKSAACDTQEIIDILNKCSAGKWNGFSGKHPKGVSDGRMFTLEAKVNGGKKLYADGSENFPKNFNTFEQFLRTKLYD